MRVIVAAIVALALTIQACGHPRPSPSKEPLKPGEKTAAQGEWNGNLQITGAGNDLINHARVR